MNQLVGAITDFEVWPKICIRDGSFIKYDGKTEKWGFQAADGYNCIKESYNNLTYSLNLTDFKDKPQSELDAYISNNIFYILKNKDARGTLSKHFTAEEPYSQYSLS